MTPAPAAERGVGMHQDTAGRLSLVNKTEAALAMIEAGVAAHDDVAAALNLVTLMKAAIKDLDAKMTEAVMGWIKVNGDVQAGENRYYVGTEKVTKCEDKRAAVLALLDATGGDVDKIADCIASDGLKQGACKTILPPEKFAELFTVIIREDVKTGLPKKGLKIQGPFNTH